MSVKVAAYKKISPSESYACSVLEVQHWAKGLADLRIEFGTHRSFHFPPRCNLRPKIQGIVVASLLIDRQLKPALFLYPIPGSKYPETVKKIFLERMLPELMCWLEEHLVKPEAEFIGHEMALVELKDGRFEMLRLRYL